jgi:hypothetical protein
MQLLPFNLSFPRICIRLLPRHLSTSLLFSALLALLCSALLSYTQLHSYIQLHSYTVTQLYSYTATQLHRQAEPTDRDEWIVRGLTCKHTHSNCASIAPSTSTCVISSLLLHLYLEDALGLRLRCELLAAALCSPQHPEVIPFTIDCDRVIIVRLAFIFTHSKMGDNDSGLSPLYLPSWRVTSSAHEHVYIHLSTNLSSLYTFFTRFLQRQNNSNFSTPK